MADQDLSSILIALKKQAVDGTPETGAGAIGLEVLPSQGFSSQVAEIVSELLSRTRMARRSRKGSEFFNWAVEIELCVEGIADILAAVLGATVIPSQTLTEADLTSCTITGGGTVLTFAGGSLITEGVRHGMTAKLAGMSVAGNNGEFFPLLDISPDGRVVTIPSGILADNATDSDFDLIISKAIYTPATYVPSQWTVDHYLSAIDRSLRGANMRFNGLTVTMTADKMIKLGLAGGLTLLELLLSGDSPNFTDPDFGQSESITALDSAIYFGATRRVDLASFNAGLNAAVNGLPLLFSRRSGDAYLGQFKASGSFTGKLSDGADFDAFQSEDRVSIYIHAAEQNAENPWQARHVGLYLPNFGFGNWALPAGGEGAAIQNITMNGGRDVRGESLGFAPTTMLISIGE